jgi:ELWxxDGT repeat protein
MWRTDGTVAGTKSLALMQPPSNDRGGCSRVVVHGDNAYFSGWDAAHGWELWQSDGTAAGTRLNTDIYPGTESSSPQELTLAGSHLFFSAASPNIGRELWAVSPQPTRHRAVRP